MLYVAVSDAGADSRGPLGRLVTVQLRHHRAAAAIHVALTAPALAAVDGISFDRSGALWMVTNGLFDESGTPLGGARLLRLSPTGHLAVLLNSPPWFNYPTAVVIDDARGSCGTLFIANGAFYGGTPNILALTPHAGTVTG